MSLSDPAEFNIRMVGNRLELTFTRPLTDLAHLSGTALEASFYESTYFSDFSLTRPPKFRGTTETCHAEVIHFVTDKKLSGLQAKLSALSREELPDTPNVGACFADRIIVQFAG